MAATEPPPPYPHRSPPQLPSPLLAPSSEAKRWGTARQMVGSTGVGRERGWNASGGAAGGEALGGNGWGCSG